MEIKRADGRVAVESERLVLVVDARVLSCADITVQPRQTSTMTHWALAVASMSAVPACYTADVDPELEATYTCERDSDCVVGRRCVLSVCTDGSSALGPAPQVLGPEVLQVFPADSNAMFPIVIGGEGLELTDPGGDNVDGQGHVEVYVDGELIELLTAGTLDGRVQTQPIALPSAPGLHRVEAVARRNDGSIYPNAEATALGAFWVDDGQEHLAFLRPAPNTEIVIGQGDELEMEVVTLNFELVNPGFVPTEQLDTPGQGHIHVFFNRNVPDCLPDCNFNYESTAFPSEPGQLTTRMMVEGGIIGSAVEGTFPLEVVAQDSTHAPYYRQANPDELVFDVINVVMVQQ